MEHIDKHGNAILMSPDPQFSRLLPQDEYTTGDGATLTPGLMVHWKQWGQVQSAPFKGPIFEHYAAMAWAVILYGAPVLLADLYADKAKAEAAEDHTLPTSPLRSTPEHEA